MGLPPFDVVMPAAGTAAGTPPALAARLAAWPNPFNPSVTLEFDLPSPGPASLRVYDAAGRRVASVLAGAQPAGQRRVTWRPEGLAGGVDLARLEAAGGTATARLVLVK